MLVQKHGLYLCYYLSCDTVGSGADCHFVMLRMARSVIMAVDRGKNMTIWHKIEFGTLIDI